MNLAELSDGQLYALVQNDKLDPAIRKLANAEFEGRKLTFDKVKEIVREHDMHFKPEKSTGLSTANKILLLVIPLFFTVHILIATRYSGINEPKKRKEFKLYISLGYLIWTIAIILFARLNRD